MTETNDLKRFTEFKATHLARSLRSTERMNSLDRRSDVYGLDCGRTLTVHCCTAVGCRGDGHILYLAEAEVAAVLNITCWGLSALSSKALMTTERPVAEFEEVGTGWITPLPRQF